jgi:FkbM family methyltransferase
MLIHDLEIKEKRGAIHVGGHDGEERDFYKQFGQTRYFEPNRELFMRLRENIKDLPNQLAFNWGVHDYLKEAELNIASNDGQSSSLLPLGKHALYHPSVKYVGKQKVKLIRLDWFFNNFGAIENYNFLNVDVQGVELNVIKSAGDLVGKFDYIYCEVNDEELYQGCALIGDIDAYLYEYGFVCKKTHWTRNHWGDALYVKKNLL